MKTKDRVKELFGFLQREHPAPALTVLDMVKDIVNAAEDDNEIDIGEAAKLAGDACYARYGSKTGAEEIEAYFIKQVKQRNHEKVFGLPDRKG